MKTIKLATVLLGFAVSTVGCKKDDSKDEAKTTTAPSVKTPEPGAAVTKAQPESEPPKAAWTGEDTAKKFQECWDAFNAKNEEMVPKCYASEATFDYVDLIPPMSQKGTDAINAMMKMWWGGYPDAKGERQLLLVNGANYAAINLSTQTNTGELMGQPPTGKKLVNFSAQWGALDGEGMIAADHVLADQATMAHQLGMHANERSPDSETAWPETFVVVSQGGETETANIEFLKSLDEKILGKDDGFAAMLDAVHDDVEFRYIGEKAATSGKAAYEKGMKDWIQMVKVTKRDVKDLWAAGDWVFASSDMTYEMLMDMPGAPGSKGKSVTLAQAEFIQVVDGKVRRHWIFENSMQYPVQLGMMDPGTPSEGDEAPAK